MIITVPDTWIHIAGAALSAQIANIIAFVFALRSKRVPLEWKTKPAPIPSPNIEAKLELIYQGILDVHKLIQQTRPSDVGKA